MKQFSVRHLLYILVLIALIVKIVVMERTIIMQSRFLRDDERAIKELRNKVFAIEVTNNWQEDRIRNHTKLLYEFAPFPDGVKVR